MKTRVKIERGVRSADWKRVRRDLETRDEEGRGEGVVEPPARLPLDNARLAERLEEVAELLEAQHANPYRVRAYRHAAELVRALAQPVGELLEREGLEGLTAVRGIGASLARTIEQLVHTDHLPLLDHLRGQTSGREVLSTVPGIGPRLAQRIHDQLGIEGLAELEAAAYDGRLARIRGFGRERVRAVQDSLAGRFRRTARVHVPAASKQEQPPIAELLDVDREYREEAKHGALPRTAPRRFNPEGASWLPILHTERGERHYTALFSNTARAHELGTTHDWVVIYRDDHKGEGQWTAVTSRFGALAGRRVIRGREQECRLFYERHDQLDEREG